VYGYDLDQELVVLHSGLDKGKRWDMRRFEKSWKLGDYWGMVVLPPGSLSAVASELDHMKAASALESLGFVAEAQMSYRKILERWSQSLSAHMGLANIAAKKKQPNQAIQFLIQATEYHPSSAMAWHNLAIMYGKLGQKNKARRSAQRALEFVSVDEKPSYLENLKKFVN
jgi:tetratricopeptide (TPR) repeat protein